MVLVATIIVIILCCMNLLWLVWPVILLNLFLCCVHKWYEGGKRSKEYYYDVSGRSPLTRFKEYSTPKYQKFFKEEHKRKYK